MLLLNRYAESVHPEQEGGAVELLAESIESSHVYKRQGVKLRQYAIEYSLNTQKLAPR